jgi:hypothetical protein
MSSFSISRWIWILISAGLSLHAIAGRAQIIGSGPSGACRSAPSLSSGGVLPGKYFESQAKDYLDVENYRSALVAFQHAAYYGNKQAQYDLAMMYLKGAKKITIDVPLGMAWLRVAAQYGEETAIAALQNLEPALTSEQRELVERQFKTLIDQYGVARTRHRVMSTFQRAKGMASFADWICTGGEAVASDIYVTKINEEFAEYVTTMYGKVTVEPIQPLSNPGSKP